MRITLPNFEFVQYKMFYWSLQCLSRPVWTTRATRRSRPNIDSSVAKRVFCYFSIGSALRYVSLLARRKCHVSCDLLYIRSLRHTFLSRFQNTNFLKICPNLKSFLKNILVILKILEISRGGPSGRRFCYTSASIFLKNNKNFL